MTCDTGPSQTGVVVTFAAGHPCAFLSLRRLFWGHQRQDNQVSASGPGSLRSMFISLCRSHLDHLVIQLVIHIPRLSQLFLSAHSTSSNGSRTGLDDRLGW